MNVSHGCDTISGLMGLGLKQRKAKTVNLGMAKVLDGSFKEKNLRRHESLSETEGEVEAFNV